MTRRRAVILPVVLFILLLVGLLSAMFAFRVNADLAAIRAVEMRFQTRLAAEAGIERAKAVLMERELRYDVDTWYNNADEFHRIVVWSDDGGTEALGTNSEGFDEGTKVFRFSLVADDPTDSEDFVRFGLTDESSKLNLNKATESQLTKLVSRVVGDDPDLNAAELVAAILDWRDTDANPSGAEGDTEGIYYQRLDKPYNVKNGNFGTVEELLLVKGVTNELLYGEDFDRNGLLTENEDDGDKSFPMDNQDGELNPGLYPYLTVSSYETNTSDDNRQRIYLKGDQNEVREQLALEFPDDPSVVDYILTVVGGKSTQNPEGGQPEGGESSEDGGAGSESGDDSGTGAVSPGNPADNTGSGGSSQGRRGRNAGSGGPDKSGSRRQRAPEEATGDDPEGDNTTGDEENGDEDAPDGDGTPSQNGENAPGTGDEAGGETGDVPAPSGPTSPVSLFVVAEEGSERLGLEHLPVLLDRTTLHPPETQRIEGLINVNTAPKPVLECIDGLTPEQVDRLIQVRATLSGLEKQTFAWLVTEEVLDMETLEKIAPGITARGQQFTIEALGYADHAGMVTRLQTIVDMIGPIAQTVYYRDLSYVGGSFPIREEDLERVRGR